MAADIFQVAGKLSLDLNEPGVLAEQTVSIECLDICYH
jgi:hypothetical protein